MKTPKLRSRFMLAMLGCAAATVATVANVACNSDSEEQGCDATPDVPCTVFVSPVGDDGNHGTQAHPVRTLKAALTIAKKGHTISLSDGTYSAAHGEVWPQRVPDGVTIEGTGRSVLSGGGESCLRFAGGGEIRGVAFESCLNAVLVEAGAFRATSVTVKGGGLAFLKTADAVLNDVTIESASSVALDVLDEAHLSVNNATVRHVGRPDAATNFCTNGMDVRGKARATLNNVTFSDFGYVGIVVADDANATLTNSTVTRTALSAACANGQQIFVADRASMTIEDSTISGTLDPKVHGTGIFGHQESTTVQVRRSKIKDVYECGSAGGRFEAEDSTFEGCERGIAFKEKSTAKLTRVTVSMTSSNSHAVIVYPGSSTSILESTISTRAGGIYANETSELSVRKSTVESRESNAIETYSSGTNLGTATDPGFNHITGDHSLFVRDNVRVDAAGNTWHPNVQGTNADGSHTPGLVRYEDVLLGKNFFLSDAATIQF